MEEDMSQKRQLGEKIAGDIVSPYHVVPVGVRRIISSLCDA